MMLARSAHRRRALADILAQLDALEAQVTRWPDRDGAMVRAARRLDRAAGTLATSVLLDSAVEHYRGSFDNPAMYTPLLVSALTLATSAHGTGDTRPAAHRVRQAVYGSAALTGVIGTGFHLYNVFKRPHGLTWQNLFYGAPSGAP